MEEMNHFNGRMEEIIKGVFVEQFSLYEIPPGYHDFRYEENSPFINVTLESLDDKHNYVSKVSIEEKDKLFKVMRDKYIPVLSIETKGRKIYIVIRSINYTKLISQLNVYLIDTPAKLNQQLFDKLCRSDKEYYNQLYITHWNSGNVNVGELSFESEEVIKVLLDKVNISYDNVIDCIDNPAPFVDVLISNFIFDNDNKNYDVLTSAVRTSNFCLVNKLLSKIESMKDRGIITELIRNYSSDGNQIFECLMKYKYVNINIYSGSVLMDCIEHNNIYIVTHIVKNSLIRITLDHISFARRLKRDRILAVLLE